MRAIFKQKKHLIALLMLATAAGVPRAGVAVTTKPRSRPAPLPPRLTDEEAAAHAAFVATMGGAAIWLKG